MDPSQRKAARSAGMASAVGWQLALSIVGGLLGGHWLDRRFGTEPWLLLAGLGVGTFAGFAALFRAARVMSDEAQGDDP